MATTDAKTGFRLPWTAERSEHADDASSHGDPAAPEAWPAADAAQVTADAPAPDAAVTGTAPGGNPHRRPSKFLADLTKAMQAAAEQAREQTLTQFQADAKAFVELIHETSAADITTIRSAADGDIAGIREWSKAEIARIREETEQRITQRKSELERQLEDHAASIEARIERVHGTVAAFESRMAAFFERLLTEDDPGAFASMAENLPEPPRFEDILPEAFNAPAAAAPAAVEAHAAPEAPEAAVDAAAPVDHQPEAEAEAEAEPPANAVAETVAEAEPVAEADTAWPVAEQAEEAGDQAPSPEVDDTTSAMDLDAAEAEAALAFRAQATAESADAEGGLMDASLMQRLAGLGVSLGPDHVGENVSTQVVVVGLVSVASIASFKRHLTRVDGIESVGVTSGPDGEFVFNVAHRVDVGLAEVVTTLPGFGARVTDSADGVIHVTAHDPETDA
ncbi:MAG TPA: hypothetical protein VFK54_09775 [Candidatus Limnocylindrales bacterium]|nr:hypothetical protein [Candidatus Limnocylindrales bacterium]